MYLKKLEGQSTKIFVEKCLLQISKVQSTKIFVENCIK
jgi:hypothetical protein